MVIKNSQITIGLFTLLLCLNIFGNYGCANMVTPQGGDKDTVAPVAEEFDPENNSVNFDADEITIKFNEYIQLNDYFNQVLISPPLDEMPDFKLKGKSLIIRFNSELKDSTTYTINFGQSIKDITEGNILDNFTYVFSTGSELDSLSVSGSISDMLTSSTPKSVYAVLYLNENDSSFLINKPYYFAKADAGGNFKINNIREGSYRLYALEDQNFNYYYDLPNENIAFQNETLEIDTMIQNQKLKLFSEDKIPQGILELRSVAYGETRIVFARPANDVDIKYTGEDPGGVYFIRNPTNDTILFWHSDYKLEQHTFEIKFDNTDTVRTVQTVSPPEDTVLLKQKNTFVVNLPKAPPGGSSSMDLNNPIILNFTHPIKSVNQNIPFKFKEDTLFESDLQFHIDSIDSRKLIIDTKFSEGVNYKIFIPQNLTRDIFNLPNDSMTIRFTTKKKIDYALLTTEITNKTGNNILLQFLSSDLKTIVREVYIPYDLFTEEKYVTTFDYLTPGVYKLRVIVDIDKNGKWTTGNLLQLKQPEPVYFFPVDQSLRANWETKIEWVIQ